jgi:uncharacterized protein YecE (DUF72 family)
VADSKPQAGELRIGTSGWSYQHWIGRFYPKGISLEAYARQFDTVEINNTFYNLPLESTFRTWRETVGSSFLFAVKASRYITHRRKLRDPETVSRLFFERVIFLGDTLGPILFQLPPRWHVNVERLAEFLAHLPTDFRYTFEFRDKTWFNEEVDALLRQHGVAFCIYDLAGETSPLKVTTDFVYIRLHGPEKAYQGKYQDPVLDRWAEAITAWSREGRNVYVYFDNDEKAYAAADALRLRERVGQVSPSRHSA